MVSVIASNAAATGAGEQAERPAAAGALKLDGRAHVGGKLGRQPVSTRGEVEFSRSENSGEARHSANYKDGVSPDKSPSPQPSPRRAGRGGRAYVSAVS